MEKYQFDIDTAVTRIKDSDTGEALFASVITNDWHTGTHPNGGYLTSIVLNAMRMILPHPDPILASVYFFNPARPGPATVRIIRLKGAIHGGDTTLTQTNLRKQTNVYSSRIVDTI